MSTDAQESAKVPTVRNTIKRSDRTSKPGGQPCKPMASPRLIIVGSVAIKIPKGKDLGGSSKFPTDVVPKQTPEMITYGTMNINEPHPPAGATQACQYSSYRVYLVLRTENLECGTASRLANCTSEYPQ